MDQPDIQFVVQKLITENLQTIEYYFGPDSIYLDWREELHDEIVSEILNEEIYSKDRNVYIIGGAPANGKSTFLKSGVFEYPDGALKIDPDEIKKKLPEYQLMIAEKERNAANAVHEESSMISKRIRSDAMDEGIDIILDGVADGTFEQRKNIYDEFKEKGYYIRMDYVTLNTTESLKIALIREEQTGRHVPPEFIESMNKEIALLVPKLIENQLFDELYLWDTNIKDNPRLILSQKGSNLDVLDEGLYEAFKIKGYGEE